MLPGAKTFSHAQESDPGGSLCFSVTLSQLLNGLFNGLLLSGKWAGNVLHESEGVMTGHRTGPVLQ